MNLTTLVDNYIAMSDDYEKKSWSEIDKLKEKGNYSTSSNSKKKSRTQQRSTDLAKAQLNDLFEPKKDPQKDKDLKALTSLKGAKFEKAASAFVSKYGFPSQPKDLLCFLDHEEPAFLLSLFEHIQTTMFNWSDNGKQMIAGQLRINLMMNDDDTCIDAMEELLKNLS